jgi:ABC-type uncharacterized transport system ATPase component
MVTGRRHRSKMRCRAGGSLRETRIARISGGRRGARCRSAFTPPSPEVFLLDDITAELHPATGHAIPRLSHETEVADRPETAVGPVGGRLLPVS